MTKQVFNITTYHKDKIIFCLPESSMMKILTWDCHVDDSAKTRYDKIMVRVILTALGLNFRLYN